MAGYPHLTGPGHPAGVGDPAGGAQLGADRRGVRFDLGQVGRVHSHSHADHHVGIGQQVAVVVPATLQDPRP